MVAGTSQRALSDLRSAPGVRVPRYYISPGDPENDRLWFSGLAHINRLHRKGGELNPLKQIPSGINHWYAIWNCIRQS